MFVYPDWFKDQVKHEYPNNSRLHKYLDLGADEVGEELNMGANQNPVQHFEMVRARRTGNMLEVNERLDRAIRREDLYKLWRQIRCVAPRVA